MRKYLHEKIDSDKSFNVLDELPFWSAPFGLKLLEFVNYRKNLTVLDIGFYSGFPLTELAMRLGDSSTIYGIDPWVEAIERAKVKIDSYGITNVNIIEGIAESIPLADKTVDLITSNNGLNNVSDIDKALSECSRIMKSGGQFVQTMNLSLSMFEFYNQLQSVLSEMKMDEVVQRMYSHIDEKRPSVEKIKRLVEKHDFIVQDIVYDQFDYRFADGAAMLNHYFIRIAFMDSWITLLPEEKKEEIFLRVELRLNELAERFGGIKLSIPFVLINAIKR